MKHFTEERYLMERQWQSEPIRCYHHTAGWRIVRPDGEVARLQGYRTFVTPACKALRRTFTDMRRRFIQSLYRGRMAGV